MLQREPVGVEREQGQDLGLPAVEEEASAVEVGLGGSEQGHVEPHREPGAPVSRQAGVLLRGGHRGLDQPGHHPRGGHPDRVGPLPGGGEVDDADLLAGHGVVHGRRPAHPVVHDGRVVLGAEHHRRAVVAGGQVERVGADAGVVPLPTGDEVDGLGLAAHHAAAVRPQDAGLGVGHGDDEVAVLRRTPQLGLHALDGDLERRAVPERRGVGLVGHRGLGDVEADRRGRAFPRPEDLRPDQAFGPVTALDEGGPRAHSVDAASVQLVARSRHRVSKRYAATLARVSTSATGTAPWVSAAQLAPQEAHGPLHRQRPLRPERVLLPAVDLEA